MTQNLIKTGDFAKLCSTTRNTLIHYDQLGLLKPAKVSDNGYRYYGPDQYMRFTVIRALIDSGFSLDKIAELLDRNDPAHLAEAAHQQLTSVRARLRDLRRAERMLTEIARQADGMKVRRHEPVIERREAAQLLVVSNDGMDMTTAEQMHANAQHDFAALRTLAAISPEAEMAPYCCTVDPASIATGTLGYLGTSCLLPKGSRIPPDAPVEEMPAGRYALLDFDEPWRRAMDAYRRLLAFTAEQGERIVGPIYELECLRLLDIDWDDNSPYPCTLLVRLEER